MIHSSAHPGYRGHASRPHSLAQLGRSGARLAGRRVYNLPRFGRAGAEAAGGGAAGAAGMQGSWTRCIRRRHKFGCEFHIPVVIEVVMKVVEFRIGIDTRDSSWVVDAFALPFRLHLVPLGVPEMSLARSGSDMALMLATSTFLLASLPVFFLSSFASVRLPSALLLASRLVLGHSFARLVARILLVLLL